MTQLTPCPECRRHVSVAETECPFCNAELDLSGVPEPAMPRSRLGRAATFAFGATVLGAALATGCGGDDEDDDDGGDAPAAGRNMGGTTSGGTAAGGASAGNGPRAGTGATSGAMAIYGAAPNPGRRD